MYDDEEEILDEQQDVIVEDNQYIDNNKIYKEKRNNIIINSRNGRKKHSQLPSRSLNNQNIDNHKTNLKNKDQKANDYSISRPSNLRTINNSPKLPLLNKPIASITSKEESHIKTSSVAVKALKNPITRKIILIAIPIFLVLLLILFVAASLGGDNYGNGRLATKGYYVSPCQDITVIFTDKKNNYEVTGTGTYDLETYVAGVIAGEVGFLGSLEVDKTFAIAARSYGLANANNCVIESSDRKQVFRELTNSPTDKLAIQAAEETKGQVLLSNNELASSQYDAFACIDKDDNYYTISQANQKIPIEWVNSKINPSSMPEWFICNGRENLKNHHGNGLSQYGSLYLATEHNYKYDQILNFYLGDNFTISTNGISSSIANLDIKVTKNASYSLDMPIEDFLISKGSSLNDYNNYIKNSVIEAGSGTREGVVTAAVAMINYLYDNYDAKLPYYWKGKEDSMGLSTNIGTYKQSMSPSGNLYYYQSFDCSGFVSWAIRNGGFNFSKLGSNDFYSKFSNNSCNVTESSCIGKPGDLIWCDGHIQLIIETDEESGKYIIADSTDYGVTMREQGINDIINQKTTKVLFLDNYYNDRSNVNLNY